MNRIYPKLLALTCVLFLAFQSGLLAARDANNSGASEMQASGPITIYVLLDGFRADYLDRGVTPNLSKLAEDGARGKITPAFPSVTFPNHLAQITGLYPDEHGLVGNVFEDKAMPGQFNPFKNQAVMTDPRWWTGSLPLWALAQEQGLNVTRTQWVVNGVDRNGTFGSNLVPLDYSAPPGQGADRFLKWFDADDARLPDLALLYFPQADSAGHKFGPDAPETNTAVAQLDAAIGKIVEGLKQRGLWDRVNIVITADHGMSGYVPGQVVFLDDLADPESFRLIGDGPYAEVVPDNGATIDDVARQLAGHHGPMTCWRKEELPERFHYGSNARVAPIFCLADPGWIVVERNRFDPDKWKGASHGYDPESSVMSALFLGHGPAFCARKSSTQRIDAVDIYPLLAQLAGIDPGPNSGDISHFNAFLRNKASCSD